MQTKLWLCMAFAQVSFSKSNVIFVMYCMKHVCHLKLVFLVNVVLINTRQPFFFPIPLGLMEWLSS